MGAHRTVQRRLAMVVVGLAVAGGGPVLSARAAEGEAIEAKGILAHGDLVLLAAVYSCHDPMPTPVAQVFVSRDDGKTWVKEGPAIDRGEFEYAYADPDAVWAAGRLAAMGPRVDPFILIPRAPTPGGGDGTAPRWSLVTISVGAADLKGLGLLKNGDLLAWIRHPDAHVKHTWGPVIIHCSGDRGQTWSECPDASSKKPVGPVKKFEKPSKQSGDWRINKRRDGGFDVQHRKRKAWETVKEFPWQQCEGPPDSSIPAVREPRDIRMEDLGKIGRDPPTATPPFHP